MEFEDRRLLLTWTKHCKSQWEQNALVQRLNEIIAGYEELTLDLEKKDDPEAQSYSVAHHVLMGAVGSADLKFGTGHIDEAIMILESFLVGPRLETIIKPLDPENEVETNVKALATWIRENFSGENRPAEFSKLPTNLPF